MKSIVIDVDGTICDAIDRNYQEAVPIQPVIDKINFLYNQGYRIILYSSRGMHSCNGDLSLIIEKNHSTLKSWLEKHKVKFHELIFGKPLADWYVDDKSLPVEDFVSAPFYELKGGSIYGSSEYFKFSSNIDKDISKIILSSLSGSTGFDKKASKPSFK